MLTLQAAEYIRSLCPDFRWLDRANKKQVRDVYKKTLDETNAKIYELNREKIKANQTITAYKDRWALELTHEFIDGAIARLERTAKRYGWILKGFGRAKRNEPLDIEGAKQVPIEQFYEGRLRRVAGRLSGRCPFHEDRTPSFTIWTKDNRWKCFGCGEGGDVIDFIQKQRNIDFKEAVKFLLQ